MTNVWDRFNTVATGEEVRTAQENTFSKATAGEHTVELVSLEASETQNGSPIMKVKFKNKFNNELYGYNLFLTNQNYPDRTPEAIARVVMFLNALTGTEYTFVNMGELANYLSNITCGGSYVVLATYPREDSKYPDFSIVSRITDGDCSDEVL